MKLLLVHNAYQQSGGEDHVFAAETRVLEEHGHTVVRYTADNRDVAALGPARAAASAVWSGRSYRAIRRLIQRERPQVAHFHNFLPLISPAAFYAARAEGVRVVHTLHNYRLVCPSAILFRDGSVCEDCLRKTIPWPAVVHRCYRSSGPASAAVATMLSVHHALGTWYRQVDKYIALTEFSKAKLVQGGWPENKIVVKPNFVHPDPGVGAGDGGYAIFVGRMSPEKGLPTLLAAWRRLAGALPLVVIGDGPDAPALRTEAEAIGGISWLGSQPPAEVHRLIGRAMCLIFPSVWYETFGRVVAEAFAGGTPVVAANLGAAAELVDHGRTGLHFRVGDAADLAAKIGWLLEEPTAVRRMRLEARAEFEAKFSGEANYQNLLAIYESVLGAAQPRPNDPVTMPAAADRRLPVIPR